MKLKVACLQLNSRIGFIKENTDRVFEILEQARFNHNKPDLIVLPELALTGYNFPSKQAILPYLELKGLGHSSNIAREISQKYDCYTVIGYPETTTTAKNNQVIFNSAMVISPIGELIHNYRKCFLYESDETWGCQESDQGFTTFDLTFGHNKVVKTAIGICMDLNPYKFQTPFMNFEFANHCLKEKAQLIICPTAWLDSASPSLLETPAEKKQRHEELKHAYDDKKIDINTNTTIQKSTNMQTVDYWILRFFPFLNYSNFARSVIKPSVIINNRIGLEDQVQYCGSSTILQFKDIENHSTTQYHDSRNESVEILGSLGEYNEGILMREIEI